MNNTELLKKFQEIAMVANPLDGIVALKKFKGAYKKSEFYKNTKMPLSIAYSSFLKMQTPSLFVKIEKMLEGDNLANFINVLLEDVDLGIIVQKLLYNVNYERFAEILQTFLPDVSVEELGDLQKQLTALVKNLK